MAKKKKKTETPKLGRPTRYKKELDGLIYKLCLLNAIDTQIAEILGISEVTLNAWKKKHPSFLKSIKRGKDQADAKVAEALFHRACGYSHPDVHISNYQGLITVTDITKHYPPDTAACFIWLKNRANWKDKTDVVFEDKRMTEEEIEQVRNHLKSQFTD